MRNKEKFKKAEVKIKSSISNTNLDLYNTSKLVINDWIKKIAVHDMEMYGQSFVYYVMSFYWKARFKENLKFKLPGYSQQQFLKKLADNILLEAKMLGEEMAKFECIEASYLIGNIYTATIPEEIRSANGVFYTPPNLTSRLLNLAEDAGVRWNNAKILDPACGGGAFLAPLALRIIANLQSESPTQIIDHIETHLRGFEIDLFSAWLSQVFVEVAVSKYCLLTNRRLKQIVEVRNSLVIENYPYRFDLIIGNPPYGKIKLDEGLRSKFKDSLYGHANLYGLFVNVGLNLIAENGLIAYVTPTGFLGGEYFKKLRSFICAKGHPIKFDFISFRKGIFENVLQETMLTIYKEGKNFAPKIQVNEIVPLSIKDYDILPIGSFSLPQNVSSPWVLARDNSKTKLVKKLNTLSHYLKDWGYEVKTGPLVWNRFKNQIVGTKKNNTFPLIWAEAINANGEFKWKAEKKNHNPYFLYKDEKNQWLMTYEECIILQRTTAKEQDKRLISTILPQRFINKHSGVVIENHLNIIKPITPKPKVSIELMNHFLNSRIADNVFRCISGSVAVSAYELENMPLPSPYLVSKLKNKVNKSDNKFSIDNEFQKLYE